MRWVITAVLDFTAEQLHNLGDGASLVADMLSAEFDPPDE